MTHKSRALQHKKDSGKYVTSHGVRYLSKKEQKEKMKNWAKSSGQIETDEQKRQFQERTGRSWND